MTSVWFLVFGLLSFLAAGIMYWTAGKMMDAAEKCLAEARGDLDESAATLAEIRRILEGGSR